MKLKIGLCIARPLGKRVHDIIAATKDVEIVAMNVIEDGWWGKTGLKSTHTPQEVFEAKPDLVVSVLAEHIFKQHEIDSTPLGVINLHPAPLPEYRGCNGYAHAIINGDDSYRVTLHKVDAGIDTGPIIEEGFLKISEGETGRSLHDKAQICAEETFGFFWECFIEDQIISSRDQMDNLAYYYNRQSLDAYRDLSKIHPSNRNRVRRAMTFYPHPLPKEPV